MLCRVAFCMAAALAASGLCLAADAQPPRPNIVLILADDLGYGDLGCYGQKEIKTPNIDRLAADGLRFTQFYAGSTVCAPSRCVLMTGKHVGRARIRGNARHPLLPEDVTVAEVLKQAGYATGLFGKWGLGQEHSTGIPTRQGFDEFFGYLDQHHAHNYFPAFLMHNDNRVSLDNVVPGDGPFGGGVATVRKQYSPDLIARRALDFIDRNHERTFFLFFASTLPHANNEGGKKGMEIPDLGEYRDRDWPEPQKGHAAMISRLDSDVGRIVAKLREHALDRKTLVLFSSDNGPHAEGGNDPNFHDSNGPLRGKKRDLYEGGIRVPMIARWTGTTPAGAVSQEVGQFCDFLATAADLAGGQVPTDTQGRSFRAAVEGREHPSSERPLYWEFHEKNAGQAVRIGKWKGIIHPVGGTNVELYDLDSDLGETHDVASQHPDIVKQIIDSARREHVPSPLWPVKRTKESST